MVMKSVFLILMTVSMAGSPSIWVWRSTMAYGGGEKTIRNLSQMILRNA